MIIRKITTEIIENTAYFPTIGIIEPRQVGKTTLAKNLQNLLTSTQPNEMLLTVIKSMLTRWLIFIQHIGFYKVVFEYRHPFEIDDLLYIK